MKHNGSALPPTPGERPLTTEEFADFLSLKSQSIRKRYSLTGSYHGARPRKAANGRLYWPPEEVQKVILGA